MNLNCIWASGLQTLVETARDAVWVGFISSRITMHGSMNINLVFFLLNIFKKQLFKSYCCTLTF
jgi:hypothetical protein